MADDRNAPATKGDIDDLRSEIKEQIGTIRSEMQESAAMEIFGVFAAVGFASKNVSLKILA